MSSLHLLYVYLQPLTSGCQKEHMTYSLWKKGVLQLALQFNFWVESDICNSLYLYAVSAIGQVARVATHRIYGATHYNSITTLLQQLLFNYYATPLWLQS